MLIFSVVTENYAEIIGINSINFDFEGASIGGDGLVTRIDSKILPVGGAGNPQKKYRIEVAVDDFPGTLTAESGNLTGVVIFYGIK